MNKQIFLVIFFIFSCVSLVRAQNVGIGTTSPDVSAQLDVTSTTKGLLVPRMTMAQRDAIGSPATGLLIFQTDNTPGFYYWNGVVWIGIASSGSIAAWNLGGNAGTVDGTDFIGTTDNVPLTFRVNNQPSGRIDAGSLQNTFWGYQTGMNSLGSGNVGIGSRALNLNTQGNMNTATGFYALKNNTSGNNNSATGSLSLFSNIGGSANVANGKEALYSNTIGGSNIAIRANASNFL